MIIVLGSIIAVPGKLQQALHISQAHVLRARQVSGCIAHGVHIDAEDPNRLVFVEQWVDQASIWDHVKSPQTRAFVKALVPCAAHVSNTEFFEAAAIQRPAKNAL